MDLLSRQSDIKIRICKTKRVCPECDAGEPECEIKIYNSPCHKGLFYNSASLQSMPFAALVFLQTFAVNACTSASLKARRVSVFKFTSDQTFKNSAAAVLSFDASTVRTTS